MPVRLVGIVGAAAAVAVLLAGSALELWRFGTNDAIAAAASNATSTRRSGDDGARSSAALAIASRPAGRAGNRGARS